MIDKRKAKVIKALEKLADRYDSITKEEINEARNGIIPEYRTGERIMRRITGFGCLYTCTVCKAIDRMSSSNCDNCFWKYIAIKEDHKFEYFPCMTSTYDAITDSVRSDKLLRSLKARAQYIREQLKAYAYSYKLS